MLNVRMPTGKSSIDYHAKRILFRNGHKRESNSGGATQCQQKQKHRSDVNTDEADDTDTVPTAQATQHNATTAPAVASEEF